MIRHQQDRADLAPYLKDIHSVHHLSAEEEVELFHQIIEHNSPDAREMLIRSNLRLVVNIARQYLGRGMPLADLVEEGNIGLLKAVEGFDVDAGWRFSTYAAWWIRQSIKRALINTVQPVHVPAYMIEQMNHLRQATTQLQHSLGREPSVEELAERMGISPRKLKMVRKALKAYHAPTQFVGKEEDDSLGEMVPDERHESPDCQVIHHDDLERMMHLLDDIDRRAAQIIRLRFGLDGGDPMTLKEVGEKIGLTRERVRQIEHETLGQLKSGMATDGPAPEK